MSEVYRAAPAPAGGGAKQEQSDPTGATALELDACVLRHVSRLSRAVVAAYDPALATHGLTGHQFNLMTTLRRMGPMSVGDLASALGMDPSGVPRAIRPLTEAGLVRAEAGEDRRRRMLAVTQEGESRLDAAQPAWAAVQEELVSGIGADSWIDLMAAMRSLRKSATGCSTRKPA